ncbi:hypothetical protein AVEN_160675-1 [Araneus ventricosus]|uniref:Uncharacterized protein n=1 Tax=Araneus ventricosus TaxID=182803 RepID=A0A4Y2X3V5_ARAVE|nr:hypothetical protein AVEN_160675-1 [Araneus ventricosus]
MRFSQKDRKEKKTLLLTLCSTNAAACRDKSDFYPRVYKVLWYREAIISLDVGANIAMDRCCSVRKVKRRRRQPIALQLMLAAEHLPKIRPASFRYFTAAHFSLP